MIKVDNAIILAAGISTRFVPLTIEKPKALIEVKKEILIERMIRQLQEKGIHDIVVVTGYKAESLQYLKEKFNVTLVHNPEYNTRNNHASLFYAQDYLKNSYICSADNYYPENVFSDTEEYAYYSSVFIEGKTKEWCISSDKNGIINHIEIGGKDSDIMIGHVFFDEKFSQRLLQIIKENYESDWIRRMLWESVYHKYLSELDLRIKRHEIHQIFEFDSLKELRKFDSRYKKKSESPILDTLSSTLNTSFKKIEKIKPILMDNELIGFKFKHKNKKYKYLLDSHLLFSKSRLISGDHIPAIEKLFKENFEINDKVKSIFRIGGLTNQNYKVEFKDKTYVVRFAGKGTNELINRHEEQQMIEAIKELEIDSNVIYFDASTGVKISDYIVDAQTLNSDSIKDKSNIELVALLIRKLHQSRCQCSVDFSVLKKIAHYESIIKYLELPHYQETKQEILNLKFDELEYVFCHNDPLPENFVLGHDRLYLVDWEYGGNNNPMWDLAAIIIEANFNQEQENELLSNYFNRKPNELETTNLLYMKVLVDFLWSLWGVYMVEQGAPLADYGEVRYQRALESLERLKEHL